MQEAHAQGFCPNMECIVLMPVTIADLDAMSPDRISSTRFYCLALSPNESRNVSRAELRKHAEKGNLFVELEA